MTTTGGGTIAITIVAGTTAGIKITTMIAMIAGAENASTSAGSASAGDGGAAITAGTKGAGPGTIVIPDPMVIRARMAATDILEPTAATGILEPTAATGILEPMVATATPEPTGVTAIMAALAVRPIALVIRTALVRPAAT